MIDLWKDCYVASKLSMDHWLVQTYADGNLA